MQLRGYSHAAFRPQSRAYTSRAVPFPLPLLPPEVRVDRRHGWVMSVLSLGILEGGGGLVRLDNSSERGRREGTARCCSALFVFSHVGAK